MKFIGKKKTILIIVGAILILFIGIAIGSGSKNNQSNLSQIESQNQPQAESQTSSITDIPVQDKSNTGLFKITRVIDGDTIEIEGGERIRYIGIDTPETVDPRKPVQCFGVEASNKNKELVEGKEIRLEKDITDRDKYDRLLRYVWVGDAFINLELVKQGFAYSYSYPPDIKYQDQFVKAQQEAREAKRGLWNACPTTTEQEESVLPPAEQKEEPASSSCLIKGNISSSGEKIYHLPGCSSYNVTKIDEARGEKWFCSEQEALNAGWRKALNCP
ncbi:thermonuclease family protein [Patescibacteria group bacterium]|nr:thermonuclease family protein [Patescibacteria group bacterium]MBU4458860.1 thermonuclease family protein [Patescibacteria group bacterium]MCG2696145.1 thermonuclease family protein [Candidatus Portnoybacteria bacterium]